MDYMYPDYNFPSGPYSSLSRRIFSYYGSSFIDTGKNREFDCQRVEPVKEFGSVSPVIPLLDAPAEVPYPWTDRVMGENIKKNKIIKPFLWSASKFMVLNKAIWKIVSSIANSEDSNQAAHLTVREKCLENEIFQGQEKVRELCGWPGKFRKDLESQRYRKRKKGQDLLEILHEVEKFKSSPNHDITGVHKKMKPLFTKLLEHYETIHDYNEAKTHNPAFAGGCLASFAGEEDKKGLFVSPSGANFDTLNLYSVFEDSYGCVRSKVIATQTVPGTIYEVRGQQVHGQRTVSVRLENSCLIYSIDVNDNTCGLTLLRQTELSTGKPTSISMSPFIGEECLIATDEGQCYLWTENCYEEIIHAHSTRFETQNKWGHSQFGSHPRQIVFADPTMVQMYDLRESCSTGHDLFALPNKLLHQKERIKMCQTFQKVPFYQIIATDYSLMMVDERFPGHAVLKWDHMLSTPPQYISVLDQLSDLGDTVAFLGSQVPAEVNGFHFRIRGGHHAQTVSIPWTVDRMRDVLKPPTVTENVSHERALIERFNSSLTGVQSIPWGSGHMIFQLNSHGDIFAQEFQEKHGQDYVVANDSPGLLVAKQWVDALESEIKQQLTTSGRTMEKDVTWKFEEIQYMGPVFTSCRLCLPTSSERGELPQNPKDAVCLRCMHMVNRGKQLANVVEKDAVVPSSRSCDLSSFSGLADINKLPSGSSLTRMLLKQWSKDKDISNELKDWDKEVLEYRKHRRKVKQEKASEMTEESILNRLRARSSGAVLPVPENNDMAFDEAVTSVMELGQKESEEIEKLVMEKIEPEEEQVQNTLSSDSANSQSEHETEITRTSCALTAGDKPRSLSLGINIDRSPSVGMYDSDRSLFSDSEISSPRKRKRHSSEYSVNSVRSTLSKASVTSFPGFLSSPGFLSPPKSSQNFTSPKIQGHSPKLKLSVSPSKIKKKKAYQPGF